MRVVGSLTTMPDKYNKIIRTLKCLNNQTYKLDAIYLSLPNKSRRLGISYPPLPKEVSELCTIVPCTDYGPITKIVGGLLMEHDPDTVIITFDDDIIYPPNVVEALLKHHIDYPNSAIGSSGMLLSGNCPMCAITPNDDIFTHRIPKFPVPPEGRRVDSIWGYPGALYVRKFFPVENSLEEKFLKYALINDDMLKNDDIVLSGYLSMNNIERRIFANMPITPDMVDETTSQRVRVESEISYDLFKFFKSMNKAITSTKEIGMYSMPEPMSMSETIAGIIIIVCLSVLLIIIITIYLLLSPNPSIP